MKLFGFQIGKKSDDDFDLPNESPPDFSQPPTDNPPANNNPYAEKDFSYDSQGNDQYSDDTFSHQIFSSDTPTPGNRARDYANSLSAEQNNYPNQSKSSSSTPQSSSSYGGAVSGHEAQLILEKLDTIKAEIDSVKQRMMRVERFMDSAEQKAGQKRMW